MFRLTSSSQTYYTSSSPHTSRSQTYLHTYIDSPESYADAKRFCREGFTDLVAVANSAEMDHLVSVVGGRVDRAWIGLEMGERAWHWALPDQRLDFLNWRPGEPRNQSQDTCGAMDADGHWFDSDCNTKRFFVCGGELWLS